MKPNTPFAFLKNNLLPPAGASLEQYYLPILETDTVAVYRYLLASYDQGEKQYLLAQILNHLNLGFPQLLLSFDRLIAMGYSISMRKKLGSPFNYMLLLRQNNFFQMLFLNACLKRKLGKRRWRICFQHAL